MKYVWKKEMPFAKIGDRVNVTQLAENKCHCENSRAEVLLCDNCIQKLIVDGWIEQIKPREFWINVYPTDHKFVPPDVVHKSEFGAKAGKINEECIETIHVREVID
jgi:hypothetical protein